MKYLSIRSMKSGTVAVRADGVVSGVTDFHILNLQGVGQAILRQGHVKLFISLYFLVSYLQKHKHDWETISTIFLYLPDVNIYLVLPVHNRYQKIEQKILTCPPRMDIKQFGTNRIE